MAPDPKARARKLAGIARAHSDWEAAHLPDAPFDPKKSKPDSDYNQHHLDVDATPEQEADLARRVKAELDAAT